MQKSLGLFDEFPLDSSKKSNHYYTPGTMPKCVTSGGARGHGLAPGQHSYPEASRLWQEIGNTVSYFGDRSKH